MASWYIIGEIILESVLFLFLVLVGVMSIRTLRREKRQDREMRKLTVELEDQAKKLEALEKQLSAIAQNGQDKRKIKWRDGAFNYLAIGNSLTLHGICDYWWNECGMAASSLEKDYVHQLITLMQEKKGEIITDTYNFAAWEVQSHDRSEHLALLDELLDERINLITVQLGENARDIKEFGPDFKELIHYLKKKCPGAQIIVVGDFWNYENREELKKKAAEECKVAYADLDAIRGKEEYFAGMGTRVYDAEGNVHVIEHGGVASHPGDSAMKYIAERIYQKVML